MNSEDWKQIEPKLHAAVGQKLNVMSMNILRSTTPEQWLDEGYDLDLDIIPAIKQFMIKFGADQVVSWRLFTPAIKHHHRQRMFRKSRSSSYADSKGFQKDDVPIDPKPVRKRAVAEWERIKAIMEIE
jgi:hypothetical protein